MCNALAIQLPPPARDEMMWYSGVLLILSINSTRSYQHAWDVKRSQLSFNCGCQMCEISWYLRNMFSCRILSMHVIECLILRTLLAPEGGVGGEFGVFVLLPP